jgi:hypothetical protein
LVACRTILYRAVGFAGGTGGGGAGKFRLDPLALAFVGLVLVDMPLSRGKLPFASRILVISWAKAGVAERKMTMRAAFIVIRALLCHECHDFLGALSTVFQPHDRRHEQNGKTALSGLTLQT